MQPNLRYLFFTFVIVGTIFISGCVQKSQPDYGVVENTTEEEIFDTAYRPSEPPFEQICATEKFPADCNEIPSTQGVEICKRCKNISGEQSPTQPIDKFIVANPLDLSQIGRLSKFRSCYGHDYSGFNINLENETLRSMKHYVEPRQQLIGSENTVKIFAPFDGKISEIRESPPGIQIYISANVAPEWQFIFFHTSPFPEIQQGASVKSGQLLGYAHESAIPNFDIGIKKFSRQGEIFDSPFLHMNTAVLNEYSTRGVSPENAIIPKAERDSNPCVVQGTRDGAASFPGPTGPENYVVVQ